MKKMMILFTIGAMLSLNIFAEQFTTLQIKEMLKPHAKNVQNVMDRILLECKIKNPSFTGNDLTESCLRAVLQPSSSSSTISMYCNCDFYRTPGRSANIPELFPFPVCIPCYWQN